ncbi:hypothetical protein CsSME_00034764 [Camellia sinensis var. sinensis]
MLLRIWWAKDMNKKDNETLNKDPKWLLVIQGVVDSMLNEELIWPLSATRPTTREALSCSTP